MTKNRTDSKKVIEATSNKKDGFCLNWNQPIENTDIIIRQLNQLTEKIDKIASDIEEMKQCGVTLVGFLPKEEMMN